MKNGKVGCALRASLTVQVEAIHGSRAAFNCASAQIQAKFVKEHFELLMAPTRHVSWEVSILASESRRGHTAHSGRLSISG